MSSRLPEDVYYQLAVKVRTRIEFAESVLSLTTPASAIVETVSLQGRKIIETIAYMMLVSLHNTHGIKGLPKDAKSHWNAETILERLKRKNLKHLPSPSIARKSDDPRFKITFTGVPEYRLSHDALIEIYRLFHKGLHEPNPYVQADEAEFYRKLVPELHQGITRLRNFIWSHAMTIQGRGFMVVLKSDQGNVLLRPLQKITDVPDDLNPDI